MSSLHPSVSLELPQLLSRVLLFSLLEDHCGMWLGTSTMHVCHNTNIFSVQIVGIFSHSELKLGFLTFDNY